MPESEMRKTTLINMCRTAFSLRHTLSPSDRKTMTGRLNAEAFDYFRQADMGNEKIG